MIVYLNGKYVKSKDAKVSVFDHGFLYGDGVYETIRVKNGEPLELKEHLRRLNQSAIFIKLKIPGSKQKISKAIITLLRKNKMQSAVIRIFVSRGIGPFGFNIHSCKKPTLMISTEPFKAYPKSITAAIVSVRRNDPRAVPPSAKTTNCLNNILAKSEAQSMGAGEAIMLDGKGFVAEGSVSNVFYLKKNILFTPKLEGTILSGVTREKVIQLAKKTGIRVVEKKIRPRELQTADRIFLTNALMRALPVSRLIWHEQGKRRTQHYHIQNLKKDWFQIQSGKLL